MERPYKYTAIHKITKEMREYNEGMKPYSPLFEIDIWEHWIDTRYMAKLRLYNYINKVKQYRPFEGTEIGKTIPILNF